VDEEDEGDNCGDVAEGGEDDGSHCRNVVHQDFVVINVGGEFAAEDGEIEQQVHVDAQLDHE
jgi:hypothetical protein